MQHYLNILRGRPWLVLLALLLWMTPRANAEAYVEDPSHYSVSLGGTNIVYFTAPVYDQKNVDQWISSGNLRVSVDGGPETTIFTWVSSKDIDGDATEVSTRFSTSAGGFFDITKGNTRETYRLTKDNSSWIYVKRNGDGYSFTFEAEWVVPYDMLGKKLTFSWDVKRDGNSPWKEITVQGLKSVTINMPAPSAKLQPFLSAPMLNPQNPGKLDLPWFLATESITKAYYEYKDAEDKSHRVDIDKMQSGTIMLDANVPHKSLRVVCNYKEKGDKGEYDIEGVSSQSLNVPLIHAPTGLTARYLGGLKAKVELAWSVPYPDDEDLVPTDFFEIQRSLTGREEDFKSIAQVFYTKKSKPSYNFIDSTLIESVSADMLKNGGSLENLTYRVRRAITKEWGWGANNNCAASTRCLVDKLHLLRISNYSARWEDQNAYTVRVSWDYANEPDAVWDERAKMVLRVISKNRDGAIVDSMTYTLGDSERARRYRIVELKRSCVTYDIDMYVDRGESPVNFIGQVTSSFFPIRTADDWKEFRNRVQAAGGQYDVNARLYADITTDQLISWESRYAYRGVFDGNGHTITFNLADTRQEFMAPFRYVGNATIKDLRTAGTINTSVRYASGLIGWAMEGATINIENCRSSVTLKSSVNGEGCLAGFIARQSGANAVIRNSKFDGSFEGTNATHNCGFVAWVARGSSMTIDNCVFAPDNLSTKIEGCQTWARLDTENVIYSSVNNHATRDYSAYIVIRNAGDWHRFAVMVNDATNRYWVDAFLDADITISEHVGVTEGASFRGTFNGNGHTITFNKSGWTERFIGLFQNVGDATIKNLHIAGTISSSNMYVGSLVGQVVNGGNLTIENCHSSMTISSSVNGDASSGGFIGSVTNGNAHIRNSKFDGSFEGSNSYAIGGFVGWTNGSVTIENCLFAPDHISIKPERYDCDTWVRNGVSHCKLVNSHATQYMPCEIREIDGKNFMVLRNTTDWGNFVKALKTNPATNAIMDADFGIVTSADDFNGIFDGNGHTLNVDINGGSNNNIAIFKKAIDYTIKNLRVTGKILGGAHSATFVGYSNRTGVVASKILNCRSSALIHVDKSGGYVLGGFVGRGNGVDIVNCLFDGELSCNAHDPWAGVFYGFLDGDLNGSVQSCLENARFTGIGQQKYMNVKPWTYWGNDANQWTKNNWSYNNLWGAYGVHVMKLSEDALVEKLGSSNWEAVGLEMVRPKMFKTAIPDNPWLALSTAQQVERLGKENWTVVNGKVVPFMFTSTIAAVTNEASLLDNLGNGWTVENGVLMPATTTVKFQTTDFMHISSESDWTKFREAIDAAKGQYDVNAVLDADIKIQHSAALDNAFSGTFDGNGHTIDVDIKGPGLSNVALFRNVTGNTTIKNLRVTGTIKGDMHSAGLIGLADNSAKTVTIERVWVSTEVSTTATHAGGIFGHSNYAEVFMNDCRFDGRVNTNKSDNSFAGEIIGWCNGGSWTMHRVYDQGSPNAHWMYFCFDYNQSTDWRSWGSNSKSSLTITQHGWDKVNHKNKTDQNEVVRLMNAERAGSWQLLDGKAVPVMVNSTYGVTGVSGFYHKNTGTIDKELMTEMRQSSVLLSWNTDNNPIDYFTVMRRVKGEGDNDWKEIATDLTNLSYEDKTVSPLTVYEYKVLGVNDCEGITTTETQVKVGECKHSGRVEGYVRFNDGTGAPGIEVAAIYDGKTVAKVKTDESGYFEIDNLSYQQKTSVEYKVAPVATGDSNIELEKDDYLVTFNATSNNETVHEFIIKNGKRFSGYVMYEGTSIPVKGVNFLVNGNKIHNAKGDFVESDYDGSFSFRLIGGNNTIQAVKDHHQFTGGGYYKNSNEQNITDDVAGIYFYDATKVTLVGRVVGGDDQGSKPLMNNLSKNNLGDSIQMVLTLEGDNTSWLVYDNLNPNSTQREEVVSHPRGGNKHFTRVKTQRKRMEITPDPKTGEYMLKLPPVRWKVQQVYCKGYPTLFQEGQVNEVIDLTDCLVPKDTTYTGTFNDVDTIRVVDPKATYHAIYNRIYHNPVEVTYKQLGYDNFDYFGDKNYAASELTGKTTMVPLVYSVKKPNWPANMQDSLAAVYTFGYPVFSVERKYDIQVQVGERYQYNNDPATGAPDLVPLSDGTVYMQNGMRALSLEAPKEPQKLDSLGRAQFTLSVDQTSNMEYSLKTVTFTVERDSTYIEAKPLQGFVLNMFPVGESQDVMTEGAPILYDILRDPPGAFSTNSLAKGATINFTYTMNLALTAGVYFNYTGGSKLQTVTATVYAPSGTGTAVGPINNADTWDASIDFLMYNAQGNKAFSHTMAVNNSISTSGDPSMVGADADLYIGSVQNVVITPMATIRAVTEDMFKEMAARLGKDNIRALTGSKVNSEVGKNIDYGTVVVIATGTDANGKKIYLVRDVALGYGPKLQSQFVYSQKQLLTQIIPTKAKEIVDMMYLGSKADAQAIADRTKQPVYLSLRQPTDSTFAVVNKKIEGHAYNTTIDKAEKGINYLVVLPKGKEEKDFSDEVQEKYQVIKAWADMIAKNEAEKLQAHDLMANYDVAGAAGVNYSETFDASFSGSFSQHFPVVTEVDYFELGKGVSNTFSAVGIAGTRVGGIFASLAEMKTWKVPNAEYWGWNADNGMQSQVNFAGKTIQWVLTPVLSYTTIGADSESKAFNRTESFNIATDPSSHLNVDVYRAWYDGSNQSKDVDIYNVFTNDNFNRFYDMVRGHVKNSLKDANISGPRSFIFRTRGGATQNPWEDQRVTKIYTPGTVLDARTLKICNPKIRLDKQSVSGVAIDDAAHFTIYLSNDSEKPEATDGLSVLQLFVSDQQNPHGAKISVNGQTLTSGGMAVTVTPGKETALQMEVRAGQGFDYENLAVGVMSPTDADHTTALTTFDVHFLHEAGGVSIAVPGDKWVLNTNSQIDSKRGWYIPVTINGFDRHQHNFDHIEFQYKETQRGDDSWTNLCSFYASDSLMANANGVRKLIPENGNIVTEFYGEGWVTERTYDLRAVLFCRNGNDFLATSSKIISGIKDTRRPKLFGTPEPKSGILTANDDIIFNFSEDIENNYLSAITNFEVKGEVNNNSLSDMVSVQFDGKGSIESEARRNFSGKNLTIDLMVKPNETGRDMPLFSHGTNGQKLQLWLTKDYKLKGVVNDQEFVSDSAIAKKGFKQVAMVLNQTDSTVTFFNGGVQAGKPHKLTALYTGTGPLVYGRTNELDRNTSQYYEGRMMEARLWYSAMDGGLIGTTYGNKRLTGYEKDLIDYYPMNEGSGAYVLDYTQGANAKMIETSWAIPRGISLKLAKADKGMLLDRNALNRTSDHDYTLMFWFKTDADGRGTLLSNGRGLKEDNGAENQFHIGFEGDKLTYRSNGFSIEVPGNWSDNNWHHYAMTVSRGRNVANIYVDKELRTTFGVDSLGGISGGYPLIGATRYDVLKENGDVEVVDGTDAMAGNVDELMFFAQALPQRLIQSYMSKSPKGDEAGLLTYLGFDRIERQKDNDLEVVPYAYSKKLYLDDKGNPRYQLNPLTKEPTDTLVRDYLFVDPMDVVLTHFDKTQAAPVVPDEEVKNLKFSFIGKDNQVLVDLDEPAAKLNHRNIYVTLRDIEDKNGNTMASPQTACYYVNNSSLQWMVNRVDHTIKYGTGEVIELSLYNYGAVNHNYTIENCPKWLTLNKYSDKLAPLTLDGVVGSVSKDLNIGTYNEIIYLVDEEGITEPLYLNLTVEGEKPDWANSINNDLLQHSMSISGQVYLFGELDTDSRDIVGVFDNENVCHGYANITHHEEKGETGVYLTVYDKKPSGTKLNFRLWQYSTGRELVLTPNTQNKSITFEKSAVLGTDQPIRFDGGKDFVQTFDLATGWNWVSFNVKSKNQIDMNTLLSSMTWTEGDMVTDLNSDTTLVFKNNQWMASGNPSNMLISPKKSYAFKVQKNGKFLLGGTAIKDKGDRTITVHPGWNGIGYTPMTNLTVETALSDYYDQAEEGDVIKSHTQFAYFTKSGNTGQWRGSLQTLKPGEGYMMLRKGSTDATFTYPFFEQTNHLSEAEEAAVPMHTALMAPSTMNISAVVEGFDVEQGDRLVAYSDGEVVGTADLVTLDDDATMTRSSIPATGFFLSIVGDGQKPIWFAIEREGETVASTKEIMTFQKNAVLGSPKAPTAIRFIQGEYEDGEWYTVAGVKLQQKPTQQGVYIYNGRKVVVK